MNFRLVIKMLRPSPFHHLLWLQIRPHAWYLHLWRPQAPRCNRWERNPAKLHHHAKTPWWDHTLATARTTACCSTVMNSLSTCTCTLPILTPLAIALDKSALITRSQHCTWATPSYAHLRAHWCTRRAPTNCENSLIPCNQSLRDWRTIAEFCNFHRSRSHP